MNKIGLTVSQILMLLLLLAGEEVQSPSVSVPCHSYMTSDWQSRFELFRNVPARVSGRKEIKYHDWFLKKQKINVAEHGQPKHLNAWLAPSFKNAAYRI